MKTVVWNRRISVLGSVAAMSLLWAIFVVPGGSPRLLWVSALAVLAVVMAALLMAAAPASIGQVIDDVEGEPRAGDRAPVMARVPKAR